ncbi:MAG: hypothetical protein EOO39_00605 [Cytophagaceae bacterium]|nr:MAG: hypothetical protein EOO39_00605 [Cytophagaceae bacterium]
MKTTFSSHSELAHAWANGQLASNGNDVWPLKFYASNMIATSTEIFSYGTHFTIAKRLVNQNGDVLVYVNPASYSNSTSKQQGRVRSAIRHLNQVSFPSTNDALAAYVNAIEEWAKHTRIDKQYQALSAAHHALTNAIAIATHLGIDAAEMREKLCTVVASIESIQERYNQIVANRKAGAEKAREKREAMGIVPFERRTYTDQEWRDGAGSADRASRGQNALLRVKGKLVQTSMGTQINKDEAIRLWPLLLRCRDRAATEPCRLVVTDRNGSRFTLDSINDTYFIIGCHTITWEEAELCANSLGLTSK